MILTAISVHQLELVNEMATFSRFAEVLEENFDDDGLLKSEKTKRRTFTDS